MREYVASLNGEKAALEAKISDMSTEKAKLEDTIATLRKEIEDFQALKLHFEQQMELTEMRYAKSLEQVTPFRLPIEVRAHRMATT